MSQSNATPNALIHETSPYLLQHAYNPVQWLPYSEEAFALAKKENKPVLISIGYSACHWCHVMEHECFEDTEVAELMNRYFVNVKVDREERSDVDMLYMQAVQLMNGQGGWPLNCFVLPDGKPFYGGTYFPKKQWIHILNTLAQLHQNEPQKVVAYAQELTKGIQQAEELVSQKENTLPFGRTKIHSAVQKWKQGFDCKDGGQNRAPKFPMPNNYRFLLRYAELSGDQETKDHVLLTLNKMAGAGLYDQLRGGFSRYSTDMIWKVPHFEKMLYDNAQLVSFYIEAYLFTKNTYYREVAEQTLNFVEKEWMGKEGCFYSAYDADSEGEEGKYYVWTEQELKEILNEDYNLFSKYYDINERGYWEHDNYILMRSENLAALMVSENINREHLEQKIEACRQALIRVAETRVKPGLDDKSICSWNAMMCTAYAQAHLAFGEEKYKIIALRSIEFILGKMKTPQGTLFRTYKNGVSKIPAFLEDYAFVSEALMNCYLLEQNEPYLQEAKRLTELSLKEFENPKSPFLYYTSKAQADLLTRNTETSDNVIPASNSQIALNLFYLSRYFYIPEWEQRALNMLDAVTEEFMRYPPGYSNWAALGLHVAYPFYEVAIVGKTVDEKLRTLYKTGLTNTILAPGLDGSELPLLKNREVAGKTLIYVCKNSSCQLPVESVEEALKQIERH
jgi:uncharacterized protein